MKSVKIFLIILSVCAGLSNLSAQQPDSLMEYLGIAARNNPGVQQKFYEYQAALQKIPQAGSLSDPELNVGIFLSPMELIGGNQVAEIQLMQMFPWFGVLKNSKDEMSLMANARFESMRDAKLQVFYDVQRTWYELHRIHENIRISEKNLAILRTLERISLVRYKSAPSGSVPSSSVNNTGGTTGSSAAPASQGMGGMGGNNNSTTPAVSPSMSSAPMGSSGGTGLSDLYRIQIEIANLENSIALLQNQRSTVVARFNAFLNRPPQTSVSLPDSLIMQQTGISLASISDTMLARNPMINMLQYEQQSLEARKRMVTRMGYPMVGLGLNYTLINKNEMSTSPMNGEDMIMPMVKVTLPIYRKKYKSMQKEADLLKTAAEQGIQATANSLQTEYYEAVQAYQDAGRRIELYKNQSQLAQKSLDIMIKSFSSSSASASLSDILAIRQQTLDFEMKRIEALTDYNTAVAWLKRLMANSEVN